MGRQPRVHPLPGGPQLRELRFVRGTVLVAAPTAIRGTRPAGSGFASDSHAIEPPVSANTMGAHRVTARQVNGPMPEAVAMSRARPRNSGVRKPLSRCCSISWTQPRRPVHGAGRRTTGPIPVIEQRPGVVESGAAQELDHIEVAVGDAADVGLAGRPYGHAAATSALGRWTVMGTPISPLCPWPDRGATAGVDSAARPLRRLTICTGLPSRGSATRPAVSGVPSTPRYRRWRRGARASPPGSR